MRVKIIEANDRMTHAAITGPMNVDGARELDAELRREVVARRKHAVLDLSGVSYLSSIGIGVLVGCLQSLLRSKAKMVILNPHPKVEEVLKAGRVDVLIPIVGSIEEAESALNATVAGGRQAFTLIELLVVVTIITVLIALLTPAMDRAIYETELVLCATTQRSMVTALHAYTADYKRYYPYRYGPENQSWKANNIYIGSPFGEEGQPNDERPLLRTIVSVNKQLNDPLSKSADFDAASRESQIEVAYNLWYGWRFRIAGDERGMFRLGDRFTYSVDEGASGTVTYSFDHLITDMDYTDDGDLKNGYASHPDDGGFLDQLFLQDASEVPGGAETGVLQYVITRWQGQTSQRGALDLNFGHGDGSVTRMNGIGDHRAGSAEDRLVATPVFNDGAFTATGLSYLPKSR